MKELRLVFMGGLLCTVWSCAAFTGKADTWMMDKLKTHAAFDMQCTEDKLSTTETGTWTYGVRGCGKQAIYAMQACNQMTHQCTFLRNGGISEVDSPTTAQATGTSTEAAPAAEAPAKAEPSAQN